MPATDEFRVDWRDACWTCDEESFDFQCTDELTPLDHFIGQDRAQSAIRFGLEVDKPGYNLFVTGLTGTGKTSAIKSHLENIIEDMQGQEKGKPVYDWAYVYNFDDPDRPHALRLPRGTGRTFRFRMSGAIRTLEEEIPKLLKSEGYESQRRAIEEEDRQTTQQSMEELEQAAKALNFAVQVSPAGVTIFPLVDGQPMSPEQYQDQDPEHRKAIDETRVRLMQQTQDTMTKVREIERGTSEKTRELERSIADERVTSILQPMVESSEDLPDMNRYLSQVYEHVMDNLHLFKEADTPKAPNVTVPTPPLGNPALTLNPFLPFEINVLVDNGAVDKLPIIIEPNPNWGNLFGRIERRAVMGTYFSDHAMLKPGALHLANGGYLVLNARDVLMAPGVWEGLKRVIRNREIRLEDPAEQAGFVVPQGLRPEPISLDVKVIITGDEGIYRALTSMDYEDFWDLFKVKAEFDYRVELTRENLEAYCSFICRTCAEENLLPFKADGAARVMEYAARLVTDQTKLSTRFGQIKDLLIEADYWARKESHSMVNGKDVTQAIGQRIYRLNLVEDRIREMVAEGSQLLDVTGTAVGQINGLAVYDLGDFSFGRPTRITAQTFAGREGVINIEREASLSGRTHDKGVLILGGYLGARYGQNQPLTLSASLCFEQSYEGVDGDSASSTEIYAVLSSLSGVPIAQNIAVTGSMNQNGEIQPIGGVNQKIEGMFDVCRLLGLTGDQGVMIPHQNCRNLMLRSDVVQAMKDGMFHVYAVKNIDDGLEVLTGQTAGERQADGSYPKGTINFLVEKRLRELNQSMRGYYSDLVATAD